MLRVLAAALLLPLLAACGADAVYAAPAEVAARAYHATDAPKLTLMTAINNRSGSGGHSALMVSGSQRVIFDPAGTWHNPHAPERGDVLYGITPTMLDYYTDYHARPTYHVVVQEMSVPPEIAARALALVEAHGPAGKATCGQAVSGILRDLGYSQVSRSWFPDRIMRDFARVPGVAQSEIHDDTVDATSPERPRVHAVNDDGIVFEDGTTR